MDMEARMGFWSTGGFYAAERVPSGPKGYELNWLAVEIRIGNEVTVIRVDAEGWPVETLEHYTLVEEG